MSQDASRRKALDMAVAAIEKNYGKGAIMRLGQRNAVFWGGVLIAMTFRSAGRATTAWSDTSGTPSRSAIEPCRTASSQDPSISTSSS